MNVAAFITKHEGRRLRVYRDSLGVPTVGVGYNLRRPEARCDLERVGADFDAIVAGKAELTDEQCDRLLAADIADAIADLRVLFAPGKFDAMPEAVRACLTDLRFNLGPTRLRAFALTLKDFGAGDYGHAAARLAESLWAKQVGPRAKEICAILRAEAS